MNLVLVTSATRPAWSPSNLDAVSADEEAVIFLARALRRRGHEVTVVYNGQPSHDVTSAGIVTYLPHADARPGYDVAIYINTVNAGLAPQAIYWTYRAEPFDPHAFAHVVVASPYMRRCLSALVPAADSALTVIPYGIDLAGSGPVPERDADLVIHASSPERGLSTLLDCWPAVVKERPHARLAIAYGWDGYAGDPGVKTLVEMKIAEIGSSVTMRRYSRQDLAELYATAGVWAYYCTGGESFCLTGVKAQAYGCVPVVRPWGGMHDTVRSGLKADDPATFTQHLITALDPAIQAELRAKIPADVAMDWDAVAALWEPLFAMPAATRTSKITQVPPTPPTLQHDLPTLNAVPMLQQLMGQWAAGVGCKNPTADPCLGVNFPPSPGGHDGIVVGWSLEDAAEPPDELLSKLGIPAGMPVLVVASTGPWRAASRRRHFSRRDLGELFGGMPECAMRCTAIGADGNGIFAVAFRYDPARLGKRDLPRVRATQAPRETLSLCMIVRDSEATLRKALESAAPIVDEVIIIDTGSVDRTAAIVAQFAADYPSIPVVYEKGTSPRYCYDCGEEHAVGAMHPGHRVAGFETPRNESIARATCDWICWLDADETLLHPERLAKYLRPSPFLGFSIPQDHHASDPPSAYKRDLPVRLFRRTVDPADDPGLRRDGPHQWPTFHTGLTTRFTGLVHEHPGLAPTYTEGVGPVMVLGDVWIAHVGYYTEHARRGRFVRNWPLMVADHQKYPARRLGLFLWLRDLCHHVRYDREQHGGQMTPTSTMLAEEGVALFREHFLTTNDLMAGDALGYSTILLESLQRGIEVNLTCAARKPELSGDETTQAVIQGRVETSDDLMALLTPKLGDWERWSGQFA